MSLDSTARRSFKERLYRTFCLAEWVECVDDLHGAEWGVLGL